MHLTQRFFLSEGSCTVLHSATGFVFLTYTPTPLTSDSQHKRNLQHLWHRNRRANALSPYTDLIWSLTELLLLTRTNTGLETIALDHCAVLHLPSRAVLCHTHRVQALRGAGFRISGRGPFSKRQHFCSVQAS